MKLLYLFLLMLPFSFVFADQADPIDITAELIKHGNIAGLSKNFASTVELTVLGEENIYSKEQAEQILTNFFKLNQPRSVSVLHRITSNPNYRFGVIIINTNNGVYRISFSLKNIKDHFELNELRIEAEKTK
ncbi:MAG: hypothetical protein JWP37_1247 [Mucilaginibacter sp.]|nr:hypothetical protein [Mucilaginibacter sp.]